MSLELLNQLEQKVNTAVEALSVLRAELNELKQENQQLKNEKAQWEMRLEGLVSKLSSLDQQ